MSDWFTALVAEACTEVVASGDIQAQLASTDRVTAQSVTDEIIGSAETITDMRAQFPDDLEEWQRVAAMREVLDRRRAVESAQTRLREAQSGRGRRSMRALPSMLLRLNGRTVSVDTGREDAIAAEAALQQAVKAYESAFTNPGISRDYSRRLESTILDETQLDEEQEELSARLRRQLMKPLTLRVNAVIDRELTASYDREFSYTGAAHLADRLDGGAVQFGGGANREAIRAIQTMIDGDLSGAVGVAGPRGIGKTTLLNRFARSTGDDPQRWQWGVCVAAPAQYDARDFLLHLFGQLCASVLGADEVREMENEMTGTRQASGLLAFPFAWLAFCVGIAVLLCGGVVIGLETASPVESARSMTDLLIAGCCAAVAVVTVIVPNLPLRSWLLKQEEVRLRKEEPQSPLTVDYRRIRGRARLVRWSSLASGGLAAVLVGLVAAGRSPNPGFLAAGALAVAVGGLYLLIGKRFTNLDFRGRFMRRLTLTSSDIRISHIGRGSFIVNTETPTESAARDWYKKVKFQQSYTTGWSGTVTLAPPTLPVKGQAGWSESKAVTPLAMSVPEIVAGFRSFTDVLRDQVDATVYVVGRRLTVTGEPTDDRPPRPVIIGIDEVDKIDDPRAAQAFFNQIKGLFGDSGCLFLISISDDAMAAYERRGLPLRDAFDSSLSTVISLSYLSRQEARTLIGSRLVRVTNPSADLLYVLSGGLPRELVRLIRRAVDLQQAYTDGGTPDGKDMDTMRGA